MFKNGFFVLLVFLIGGLIFGQTPAPTPTTDPYPTGTFQRTYNLTIIDIIGSSPLAGASVTMTGVTSATAVADVNGQCTITIYIHDTGTVSYSVSAPGYYDSSQSGPSLHFDPVEILMIPEGVLCDPGMGLLPYNQEVAAGENLNVEWHIYPCNQTLAALDVTFTYDSEFMYPDTTIGNNGVVAGAQGFVSAVNAETPGQLRVTGFDAYGVLPVRDMHILTFNFTANNIAATADMQLTIDSLIDNDLSNWGSYSVMNAQVSIIDAVPGDVNGDGNIDIIDALLTAQYYVGLQPQMFNLSAADVNCDGQIDIIDALLIAQYYVGLIQEFCV